MGKWAQQRRRGTSVPLPAAELPPAPLISENGGGYIETATIPAAGLDQVEFQSSAFPGGPFGSSTTIAIDDMPFYFPSEGYYRARFTDGILHSPWSNTLLCEF